MFPETTTLRAFFSSKMFLTDQTRARARRDRFARPARSGVDELGASHSPVDGLAPRRSGRRRGTRLPLDRLPAHPHGAWQPRRHLHFGRGAGPRRSPRPEQAAGNHAIAVGTGGQRPAGLRRRRSRPAASPRAADATTSAARSSCRERSRRRRRDWGSPDRLPPNMMFSPAASR